MAACNSISDVRSSLTPSINFVTHWPEGWARRSLPYRRAFHSGVLHRTEGIKILHCPYPIGTADADAWLAGLTAGQRHGDAMIGGQP